MSQNGAPDQQGNSQPGGNQPPLGIVPNDQNSNDLMDQLIGTLQNVLVQNGVSPIELSQMLIDPTGYTAQLLNATQLVNEDSESESESEGDVPHLVNDESEGDVPHNGASEEYDDQESSGSSNLSEEEHEEDDELLEIPDHLGLEEDDEDSWPPVQPVQPVVTIPLRKDANDELNEILKVVPGSPKRDKTPQPVPKVEYPIGNKYVIRGTMEKENKDKGLLHMMKSGYTQGIRTLFHGTNFMDQSWAYSDQHMDYWLVNGDFEEGELDDETHMLMVAQVTSLYEQVSGILSYANVSDEDRDDNFNQFLNYAPNVVQYIMQTMMDRGVWTFDPMVKFTWVYLMQAVRHENRAIKYLINGPYFNKNILVQRDRNGYNCIATALRNTNMYAIKTFVDNDLLTIDMLTAPGVRGIPSIFFTVNSFEIFKYLYEKLAGFKEAITHIIDGYPSLFMVACKFNTDVARFILHSEVMTKEYFNSFFDANGIGQMLTPLMVAALENNNIFGELIDSEFVDSNVIGTIHGSHGNVLTMLIRYNKATNYIKKVLNSPKCTPEIVQIKIPDPRIGYSNHLLESLPNPAILSLLLESPHFDPKMINEKIGGETLLFEALRVSMDSFRLLIKSKHCSTETLREKNNDGHTVLTHSISKQTGMLFELLDVCPPEIKYEQCPIEENRNFAMMLLARGITTSTMGKLYPYLDEKLMNQTDNNGFNTLVYIAQKYKGGIVKLLEAGLIKSEMLQKTLPDGSSVLFALCIMAGQDDLEALLNSEFVTDEMFAHTNNIGNNLIMEVAMYAPQRIETILLSSHYKDEMVGHINKIGDNMLMMMIRKIHDNMTKSREIIAEMINDNKYGPTYLNHVNPNSAETAFLLACRYDYQIARQIMDSPYFDKTKVFVTGDGGKNCFLEACQNGDYELVKFLAEMPNFSEKVYSEKDKDGNTALDISLTKQYNPELFGFLISHKFCNTELLNQTLKKVTPDILVRHNFIPQILLSPYCTKDTLLIRDGSVDSYLHFAIKDNHETARMMIESPYCSPELLQLPTSKEKRNCLQLLTSKEQAFLVTVILNSPHLTPEVVQHVDADGNTVPLILTGAGMYDEAIMVVRSPLFTQELLIKNGSHGANIVSHMSTIGKVSEILALPYLTQEGLRATDVDGRSCLHHIVLNKDLPVVKFDYLNRVLNSSLCSHELLEMRDKDGNSFLTLGEEMTQSIFKLVLDSPHCRPELLTIQNNQEITLLADLVINNPKLVKILLDHPKATKSMLISETGLNHNAIMVATEINNECLKMILSSKLCDNECINRENKHGYTPITYCVVRGMIDKVDILLNSKFDLTPSFKTRDQDGRTLLMLATFSEIDIFKMLMESKYVEEHPDLLSDTDRNGHNLAVYVVGQSLEKTMYLVESPYWTDEIKYHQDIDEDFMLLYPYQNPQIVQYLLNSGKCDQKMVQMKNKFKMNVAHCYAERGGESFSHLINSPLCTKELLEQKDIFGNLPIHLAVRKNSAGAEALLKSPLFDPATLELADRSGCNPFMIALQHDRSIAQRIWNSGHVTQKILSMDDNDGNTTLHYVVRYHPDLTKQILDSGLIVPEIFNYRNKDLMTPVMYAARYNGRSVAYLIDSPLCNNDGLYKLHTDYGSALTLGARYQPEAVKHILRFIGLTQKVLCTMDNGQNFMTIACTYQPLAVKYAIDSEHDMSRFLCNPCTNIIIAAKYQPKAVQYILESKYGSSELFFVKDKDEMNCVEVAHLFQPKALWHMIESKHSTHDILNQENHRGYRLLHVLQKEYPGLQKFEDLKNNPLIEEENIVAADEDSNICGICYEFQTKIFFWPCCHAACVGCAFKEKECHLCRERIKSRHIIRT